MTFHFYKDDQQFGPYSLMQIQNLLQQGILVPGDLAWADGGESFIPVETVSDLVVVSSEKRRRRRMEFNRAHMKVAAS